MAKIERRYETRIAALEVENKNLRQRVNELEEELKNYVEDEIDAFKRELVQDDRIEYLARQLEELAREFAYHRHQSIFGMYTGKPE
ncbi:MAG: hypothetical protein H0Z35_12490 [Thermoanaerobacteraceae bacterium]|nr:hypothetical protein [Thermoanaerobacteraceae bacterium]